LYRLTIESSDQLEGVVVADLPSLQHHLGAVEVLLKATQYPGYGKLRQETASTSRS